MSRLKNITRGLVIVPDARLRMAPGAVAEVVELTPHCLGALRCLCVAKIDPVAEVSGVVVASVPPVADPVPKVEVVVPVAAGGGAGNRAVKKEKDRREQKETDVEGSRLEALQAHLAEAGGDDQ